MLFPREQRARREGAENRALETHFLRGKRRKKSPSPLLGVRGEARKGRLKTRLEEQ